MPYAHTGLFPDNTGYGAVQFFAVVYVMEIWKGGNSAWLPSESKMDPMGAPVPSMAQGPSTTHPPPGPCTSAPCPPTPVFCLRAGYLCFCCHSCSLPLLLKETESSSSHVPLSVTGSKGCHSPGLLPAAGLGLGSEWQKGKPKPRLSSVSFLKVSGDLIAVCPEIGF